MIVLDDEIVHSLWAKELEELEELEEFKDVKIKSFMNGEDFQEWLFRRPRGGFWKSCLSYRQRSRR